MNRLTWRMTVAALAFASAAGLGSRSAAAAMDACKQTAKLATKACKLGEVSDTKLALGKCANLPDATAKKACNQQASMVGKDGLKECQDKDALRLAVCARLGPAPYVPVVDPANFTNPTTINNPYYPLPPGKTFVYEGTVTEAPGGMEHVDFIVTHRTRVIQGITCLEVHDKRFLNGDLVEDTRDWFAQDNAGNVWYFGENTTLVDQYGLPVDLGGTWTGGEDGAQPGLIMEAHPAIGDFYRQEFLLNEAEDLAEVVSLTETVTVPYPPGTFNNCLKTSESAPVAPGDVSPKFYFAGVGNLLTVEPNGDRSELIRIDNNLE